MGALQPWHWIVLIIVLVLLFGSKKLPEAARGLGRSMRIFKSEVQEMQNDGKKSEPDTSNHATPQSQLPASENVTPTVASTESTHEQHPRSA
ncbi:MAG: Sec-independent protein translocase subunit TatA [Rhodococcus sp. (in: high G+C Gram-positive bacteria)]